MKFTDKMSRWCRWENIDSRVHT